MQFCKVAIKMDVVVLVCVLIVSGVGHNIIELLGLHKRLVFGSATFTITSYPSQIRN